MVFASSLSVLLLAAGIVAGEAATVSLDKKSCVIPHSAGKDDSPAILATFKKCSKDSTIEFAEPIEYNMWTPVALTGLSNVKILLNGNINIPKDIATVQQKINSTANPPTTYATPWIYFQGTDVKLLGSSKPQFGRFNMYGQQWWDIGLRVLRPQLATFNVTNGVLKNLKVIKAIAWGFSIPGSNIKIEDHYVDSAPSNSTRDKTVSFPFNTDGFNFSGKNITLDGYYGHNGDDCVSVVNGADHIVAKNGYCGFSSHGLSVGSLGRNGADHHVANVLFENWTMEGAVYGARFKSWTGGRGGAANVTWRNINVLNVSTPIFVTQNYYDQDKGPRPNNTNQTSTHIDNFHFENFSGYINPNPTDGTCISNPCWNFVQGADGTQGIIFDLFNGTATNLHFKNINVRPYKKSPSATTVICDPLTLAPGEQKTLGFQCVRGPYKATKIEK